MRQRALMEILTTEEAYVAALETLERVYLTPLKKMTKLKMQFTGGHGARCDAVGGC
jgi:hypothetical protein